MKSESAKKLLWIKKWILTVDPHYHGNVVKFKKKRGLDEYDVSIYLPVIDKNLSVTVNRQIDGLIQVADEACVLIDEYLNSHTEIKIDNPYSDSHQVIEYDDKGKIVGLAYDPSYIKSRIKKMDDMRKLCKKNIKGIIDKVDKNQKIFIKVIDKSFYGDMALSQIHMNVTDYLKDVYQQKPDSVSTVIYDDYVIIVGYFYPLGE